MKIIGLEKQKNQMAERDLRFPKLSMFALDSPLVQCSSSFYTSLLSVFLAYPILLYPPLNNLTLWIPYALPFRGAWWLNGSVLDLRSSGWKFKPHRRHCVVSLNKTLYPLLSSGSIHEDPSPHDQNILTGM